MTDPYKVLGLASTATDDEVKAAYRKLAKKYHPDANPGDKYAEMKMKEINAAYDSIVNGTWAKSQSGQGNPYGSYGDPFGGYGNPYGRQGDPFGGYGDPFDGSYGYGRRESRSEEDPHLQAALNYMNYGRWNEAVNVLNGIQNRDAKWYYYSALAQEGLGNRIEAVKFATRATEMDPYNEEYHRCLERLQNPNAYSGYRRVVTFPSKGSSSICGGFVISWLMCMYCNFCCR